MWKNERRNEPTPEISVSKPDYHIKVSGDFANYMASVVGDAVREVGQLHAYWCNCCVHMALNLSPITMNLNLLCKNNEV